MYVMPTGPCLKAFTAIMGVAVIIGALSHNGGAARRNLKSRANVKLPAQLVLVPNCGASGKVMGSG